MVPPRCAGRNLRRSGEQVVDAPLLEIGYHRIDGAAGPVVELG
jgi:hypothetical protein